MRPYAMTLSGTTLLMCAMLGGSPPVQAQVQAQSDGRMDITLTSTDRNSLLRNQVNGVSGGNRNTNETTDVPTITRGTGSERVRTDQITGPLSSNPGSDRSNRGGELRGLDRADQVAGEQGRQGRDIAADNQQSQPGFREIRSDLRDLGRNLRDVREAAAELHQDFRNNASPEEIRSDVKALMGELKDAFKDRRELRIALREFGENLPADPEIAKGFREVRSDFRDLGRNLKDVREAAAELRRDLRNNASPEEIRSDLRALMSELNDVSRDRRELRTALKDLQADMQQWREASETEAGDQRNIPAGSNRGGELRGLDRADQVAGEQGRQGRDIAADNQQSQPGFREIRSDLRDLGRNLRDVREAAAELRRDFRSNASSGEIRSDVRALMSELKDVYKDRRELRADIRDLRQMLSEDPRTHQEMNEVRSDFRDLGRNLKDVREAAAELRRDLRSNASPEEIRSDLKALMGELKDVARDRSELQASLRDLRQNIPANSDMRQDIREVVRLDVRDTARDQRSLRDNRDAREFTHESGEKPAQRPAR